MANLELDIPQPTVLRQSAFRGTVIVSGATPGATIQVSLRQTQGSGSWSGSSQIIADADGSGMASFPNIVLDGIDGGIDLATLLATATDSAGDHLSNDAKGVQVIS